MSGLGGAAWRPARPASRAALLGVTVLLHAALLAVFMASGPVLAPPGSASAMQLVWIRPPPIAPASVAAPAAPRQANRQRRARLVRPPDRERELPARSANAAPGRPAAPLSAGPAAEPVFDRNAALAAARAMASEPDPARAGTAVAQFDRDRRLRETDTEKLGRAIAAAKRGDCIGPNARGNLLTPLTWLLDKKGGGCKL